MVHPALFDLQGHNDLVLPIDGKQILPFEEGEIARQTVIGIAPPEAGPDQARAARVGSAIEDATIDCSDSINRAPNPND